MRLCKNVSKMVLGIKTPRRMFVEPGSLIDLDSLGNIAGTDVEMYLAKGILSEGKSHKAEAKPVSTPPSPAKSRKTEVKSKDGATVVQNVVKNDDYKPKKPVRGNVSQGHSIAAVIEAPADTPESLNLQDAEVTKGHSFDALPPDVREKIAAVEQIAAKDTAKKAKKKTAGSKKEKAS